VAAVAAEAGEPEAVVAPEVPAAVAAMAAVARVQGARERGPPLNPGSLTAPRTRAKHRLPDT